METLEAIATRRSIGKVKPDRPPRELIERMLEAAVQAPNHHVTEPWRFFVLAGQAGEEMGRVMADVLRPRLDERGGEDHQRSSGGAQGNDASLGTVLGPSVSQDEGADVVEKLIRFYLVVRESEVERFIDVVRRVGIEPFKEHVYGTHHEARARSRHLATA